jgi:hypothetical protein
MYFFAVQEDPENPNHDLPQRTETTAAAAAVRFASKTDSKHSCVTHQSELRPALVTVSYKNHIFSQCKALVLHSCSKMENDNVQAVETVVDSEIGEC